jgi:hypothetical protein
VVGISIEGRWCAQGRIQDISVIGARIEACGAAPSVGTSLRLGFLLSSGPGGAELERFELPVSVARHTESGGVGVAFDEADPRLSRVVEGMLRRARQLCEKQVRAACALSELLA